MWLFMCDPKISHHQIIPIKYNMNWFQAKLGHICCISVTVTANLAEVGLQYFRIFSEQVTHDPVTSTAGISS